MHVLAELVNVGYTCTDNCKVEMWIDTFHRNTAGDDIIYNCGDTNKANCNSRVTETPRPGWVKIVGSKDPIEDPAAIWMISKGSDVTSPDDIVNQVDLYAEAQWMLPSVIRPTICQTKAETVTGVKFDSK